MRASVCYLAMLRGESPACCRVLNLHALLGELGMGPKYLGRAAEEAGEERVVEDPVAKDLFEHIRH